MSFLHRYETRVYYQDTDAGGIVYHATYLKFAERARTEALRLSGIDQSELMREQKVGFVVRRCTVDFLKPAHLDDLLTIETGLNDISKVSMELHQTVRRGAVTLVTMEVKLAVVGDGMKLAKLPDFVRKAMLKILG